MPRELTVRSSLALVGPGGFRYPMARTRSDVSTARRVSKHLEGLTDGLHVERFWVLPIDMEYRAIYNLPVLIHQGTHDQVMSQPGDVLEVVLAAAAPCFICVHNHPGGDPLPSKADYAVTRRIENAARLLDRYFRDHIILTNDRWYSFRESTSLLSKNYPVY